MTKTILISLVASVTAGTPFSVSAGAALGSDREAAWTAPLSTAAPPEALNLTGYLTACNSIKPLGAVGKPLCTELQEYYDFCAEPASVTTRAQVPRITALTAAANYAAQQPSEVIHVVGKCQNFLLPNATQVGALTGLAAFGIGWQDAVIRGLSAFITKRAKATVLAYAVERLRRKVCSAEESRRVLAHTCELLAVFDPFTAPLSWSAIRDAVVKDLRGFPLKGMVYVLKRSLGDHKDAERWFRAADILVATVKLMSQIREGKDVLETIGGLRKFVGDVDRDWMRSETLRALYTVAALAQIVHSELDPLVRGALKDGALWKPSDEEIDHVLALLVLVDAVHERDDRRLLRSALKICIERLQAVILSGRALDNVIAGNKARAAEARVDERPHYLDFVVKIASFVASAESVAAIFVRSDATTPGTAPGDLASGLPTPVSAAAAFRALEALARGVEAAREGDFTQMYVKFVLVLQEFVPAEEFPEWIRVYVPFFISIATAKDSESVEKALEAFAAPPGSYMSKRRSAGFTRVALNAYVGLAFGGELLLRSGPQPAVRVGPFVPVGIEVSRSLKKSSISGFVSVIDLGALLDYRVVYKDKGSETVESKPQIGFAQVVSPGIFAVFGLGRSPLAFGLGGSLTPELRAAPVAGSATTAPERFASFRFGAFLAVDIPLLFLR